MRALPQRVSIPTDPKLETLVNDILASLRAVRGRSSASVRVKESATGTCYEVIEAGGGGTSSIKRLRYVSQDDNTLQCVPVGALTPTIYVAKPPDLRNIASETIDGVAITYSSYNWSTQKRLASGTIGGAAYSEWQMITPPWQLYAEVIAEKCDLTGVTVGGSDVGYVARADGRAWAWENPQPPS